jgi:hypothetical protein
VAVGTAVVAAVPAVVGAWPVRATAVEPDQLAATVLASTDRPYQGYVEARGSLGLPDLPGASTATGLLGGPSKIRVWRASSTAWRVDLLDPTGETDTYGDATGTWTWESSDRRVWRTEVVRDAVRLPQPADVVPAEVGRRLLTAATPSELQPLGAARVAGHDAPGVRIVPSSPVSTIDHVDLWADATTGVVLRVSVVSKGESTPAFESQFLDVSFDAPSHERVTFVRPAGARIRRGTGDLDLVQQLQRGDFGAGARLPATIAGLTRGSPAAAIATFGDGFGVVAVMAVPSFFVDAAIPDTFPLTARPWGGEARLVETPLVNAMALTSGKLGYVVAGAVTTAELDRIAADINATRPGQ